MNAAEVERKAGERIDDKLPNYAWPGGDQIIYLCVNGEVVCNNCATEFVDHPDEWNDEECTIIDVGLHQEGPTIQCAHCYRDLESDYSDPDEENA